MLCAITLTERAQTNDSTFDSAVMEASATTEGAMTDEVVCPDCMHTACNSMYFVRAAAVSTKSKK